MVAVPAPIAGMRRGGAAPASAMTTAMACLLVMLASAFLLLNRLGEVHAPIWDEAYYLPSAARYHEGRVQFATHPPLGLMLIAAGDGGVPRLPRPISNRSERDARQA